MRFSACFGKKEREREKDGEINYNFVFNLPRMIYTPMCIQQFNILYSIVQLAIHTHVTFGCSAAQHTRTHVRRKWWGRFVLARCSARSCLHTGEDDNCMCVFESIKSIHWWCAVTASVPFNRFDTNNRRDHEETQRPRPRPIYVYIRIVK